MTDDRVKIEQIALAVGNLDLYILEHYSHLKWVQDRVTCEKVFHYAGDIEPFTSSLAFNYDIMPGREYELIEIRGKSVQTENLIYFPTPSHIGYHLEKGNIDALHAEISRWETWGFKTMQVAETVLHSASHGNRYRYAFIDTRNVYGLWTKIISRLPQGMPICIEQSRLDFKYLGKK